MVKLDEETRKALLLFNRRAEAAESEAVEDKRLAKAATVKDDAARALEKAQDAGAGEGGAREGGRCGAPREHEGGLPDAGGGGGYPTFYSFPKYFS